MCMARAQVRGMRLEADAPLRAPDADRIAAEVHRKHGLLVSEAPVLA